MKNTTLYASAKDVVNAILKRAARRWPINSPAVLQGAHRDPKLYWRALTYCESWKNALKRAGFDPAIVRRSKASHTR